LLSDSKHTYEPHSIIKNINLKIVILQDDLYPEAKGGASMIVFELAKKYLLRGHRVSVITATQNKKMVGRTSLEGLDIYRLFSDYHERWRAYLSLYNPTMVTCVKKILNAIKPDIVHAHNIHKHISYYALRCSKKTGAKVFLTAHDAMLFHYGKFYEFIDSTILECPQKINYKISAWQQLKTFRKRYNPFRNIIIRHYLRYLDKIFSVSHALEDALNQNGITNTLVIYNGIDLDAWRVSDNSIAKFKDKYQLGGKKIILFGGQLSPAKGAEETIRALRLIVRQVPNATLLVLGNIDSNYSRTIGRLMGHLRIMQRAIFTGWLTGDELKAAYWACDIAVFPSLCLDTFGMVNIEAMAAGKPVIGTCFGGTPEIIVNGMTGYVINPYDINKFAEKAIDLLINADKSYRFGEAGQKRVKEVFDIDIQVDKYLELFTPTPNMHE